MATQKGEFLKHGYPKMDGEWKIMENHGKSIYDLGVPPF